jgi:2'-5' RNA ligase
MSSASNGCPINSFALVAYIPPPLSSFLDQARGKLVSGCASRAHVTLLPPRPLFVAAEEVTEEIRTKLSGVAPFEVEATKVEMFPMTSVIYVAIGRGLQELQRLHDTLNLGNLSFEGPFSYHPHITLAQELPPEQIESRYLEARRLWEEFHGQRTFTVKAVTLVQCARDNTWVDLAECVLAGTELPGARSD